ncbi:MULTISPECIES: alpha/beta hydrolase [unclassified Rhodococcus (in: high G+C Gram-positive bacteria)]|uniref:serine aminopeptidase domain-containing protein n=1 Tax=Rhodococcus TaxID=1827 RepID=UPI00159F004E|nr:alpha/beta hydrolase [Rhodococcus sp. 1139]
MNKSMANMTTVMSALHAPNPTLLAITTRRLRDRQTPTGIRTIDTWIPGPGDGALFASVHLPSDAAVRGAVVICPPLAKEHISAYRGLRQLAQELAEHGFLALRFDYEGQGDSSGRQDDPLAVAHWQASVTAAVSYVRRTGIESVAVAGLRAGALLAASTVDTLGDLRAMVLWDPVISGRAYVRELTSLYRVSVDDDPHHDDCTSIVGGLLASAAVNDLSGLDLSTFDPSSSTKVLAAIRPEFADSPRMVRMLERSGAERIFVERQNQFVSPSSFVLSVPTHDIQRISSWVSRQFGEDKTSVDPEITSAAHVATADDGEEVWEILERRSTGSLFAISTASRTTASHAATAIFHSTANEHRIGPARLWVESARTLASHGIRSIRFDRMGTGDSGTVCTDESTPIVSPEARRNVLDLVDTLDVPPSRRMHVGMCSGAWMGAFAASQRGARSVVLLNIVNWSINNRRPPVKKAHVDAMESDVANRIFLVARTIRNSGRRAQRYVPYPVWLGLGFLGLVNAPESMLRTLTRRGTKTAVSLSPEDEAWFEANRGRRGIARLSRSRNPPQVLFSGSGDHNLFHRSSRERVRRLIVASALDAFGDRKLAVSKRDQERLGA